MPSSVRVRTARAAVLPGGEYDRDMSTTLHWSFGMETDDHMCCSQHLPVQCRVGALFRSQIKNATQKVELFNRSYTFCDVCCPSAAKGHCSLKQAQALLRTSTTVVSVDTLRFSPGYRQCEWLRSLPILAPTLPHYMPSASLFVNIVVQYPTLFQQVKYVFR